MKQTRPMPRTVQRRIMQRAAAIGRGRLVLVVRDGKPSRVYDEQQMEKRKALTKEGKPWQRRRKRGSLSSNSLAPDPLGAWDLGAVGSLRREDMYE